MKVASVHLCISGFTQNESREHGVFSLKEKMLDQGHLRVWLREWNDNWENVAEHLWMLNRRCTSFGVNVYAYSWGAGWGFVRLAKEMRKRGLSINCAVLSDPVFRHPNFFLRWTSLLARDYSSWAPFIRIPANVDKVHHFYQRLNRPQGHMLLPEDVARTGMDLGTELQYTHQYMDDAVEWHSLCLQEAINLDRVVIRPPSNFFGGSDE